MMEPNDDYYERASGWAVAQAAGSDCSRRIAWTIAIVAVGVVVVQAVALILLTPLKTVEPVTLLVDRQTGYVQALKPLAPARIAGDAALTQSFLVQYVIAREGFDRATLRQDYRKVALWSSGRARSGYLAAIAGRNPDSPVHRFPPGDTLDVRVKSVTPLGKGLSQVRFDTRRANGEARGGPVRAWVATIRYRYSNAPMTMEDRFVNPLGFQVLDYRRATEALPVWGEAEDEAVPATTIAATIATPAAAPAAPPGTMAIIVPTRQVPLGSPLGPGRR